MGDIILFLIIIISIVIWLYSIYIILNKSKSITKRIICIAVIIVVSTLLFIYYLDRFNMPTKLGFDINVSTHDWLSFVGSYITGILSAGISAVVSVFVTIYQIKKNNEENIKRDSESLRIQNMPMLKYDIRTTNIDNRKIDVDHLITSNCDDEKSITYELIISIKNIGLNNVKRIIIDFDSNMVNNINRIMGKNTVVPIEKNEIKDIYKCLALESGKEYQIKLKVYYEDVLQNWYFQTVNIIYEATKVYNGSYPIGIVNYRVNEEVIIDVTEIPDEVY